MKPKQRLSALVDTDRRLQAFEGFVAAYEADHGEITPEEIVAATRRVRSRAIAVRTQPRERSASTKRRQMMG